MKKTIKILFVLLLLTLIIQINLYATTIDTDVQIGTTTAIHSSDSVIGRFLGVFQGIGSVISVIALIIIGFRYMFSSLEEKAEMKGILIYYIVGAVLVFGTTNILSIVYKVIAGL